MLQTETTAKGLTAKRTARFILAVTAIGFGLSCFLISPLYARFATDALYMDEWWVFILYVLAEGGIDLAVFSLCYPATIFAIWEEGVKGARKTYMTFGAMTLVKYILNYVMTCLTDSALPNGKDILTEDLPLIGGMLLLELGQYALVILAVWLIKRRAERKWTERNLRESLAEEAPRPALLPFEKLTNLKNPLQRSIFWSALLIWLFRVYAHVTYQITIFLYNGNTEGLAIMFLDFITDVILAVAFYFVGLLTVSKLNETRKS